MGACRIHAAVGRASGFGVGSRIAREGFAMTAILTIHAMPAELGVLTALARGPGAVVGLIAGGIVDRSRRRHVMIFSDLVRVALILTVPIAAWLHLLTMPQLYVCAALVGGASVLFEIADHAFLPSLIDRDLLLDGNAKLSTTDAVAEIGGPAMAGALFQIFTAPIAMLGTAITYFISALLLFTVPARELPPEKPLQKPRWYRDVADGFNAIMAEPLVRPLLGMGIVFPFFGSFFGPLYLLFGLKVIGLSPALMGLNIACGGIGALFGATLSNRLARHIGIGPTIWGCCFAYAAFLMLVPLAREPLWLGTAMLMIAQLGGDGFAVAFMIPATSLRQAALPPALLGRAAAFFHAANGSMTVVGAILGGLLGEWLGIREALFIAVIGMATAPLFVLFSPLRTLDKIPEQ
jgi:predicted MFS family arabinose efflux permease